MLRCIDGFHRDDQGEWVAELSCWHNQHVRHQPPFRERPWVTTDEGRASRIGASLDCPLCDRAELPDHLQVVRTAGPFDDRTLPSGLRRDHRVAERTWAVLRILDGTVRFTMETDPRIDRFVSAGERQAIPPDVAHAIHVDGAVRLTIDFLTPKQG